MIRLTSLRIVQPSWMCVFKKLLKQRTWQSLMKPASIISNSEYNSIIAFDIFITHVTFFSSIFPFCKVIKSKLGSMAFYWTRWYPTIFMYAIYSKNIKDLRIAKKIFLDGQIKHFPQVEKKYKNLFMDLSFWYKNFYFHCCSIVVYLVFGGEMWSKILSPQSSTWQKNHREK